MNKNVKVPIIAVLVIAIISIGIAFAAFSRNLTINGNGTIESSKWEIVFEGLDSEHPDVLGSPTIPTGTTGAVTTAPTIKNNSTEISNYAVTLRSPGDSITYNFKIHNKGDYAASVSSVVMNSGSALSTSQIKEATINSIEYKLYYTESNNDVGQDTEKDCLAPGEEELVSLRIVFSSSDETDPNVLPDADVVLDRLGITVNYTQEDSCSQGVSGGGGSGSSNVVMSVGTPSVSGSQSAASITAPTVSGTSISGATVSIPSAGDSVTYPITFTSSTARELTSVTIPSVADLAAANPGIDSSVFDDIEITVTDGNGTVISAANRPCSSNNLLTQMNIILTHKAGTSAINSNIVLPTMTMVLNEVNDCDSSAEYLTSSTFANNVGTYTWTNNKSNLATLTSTHYQPTVYIKRVNNVVYNCLNITNREYCFAGSVTPSILEQECSNAGGVFETGVGCGEALVCTVPNIGTFYVEYTAESFEDNECVQGENGYHADGHAYIVVTDSSTRDYCSLNKSSCEEDSYGCNYRK